jgi:hypothetical protein
MSGRDRSEQPVKRALQLLRTIAFVAAAMRQDDPLRIPFDHLCDGSTQLGVTLVLAQIVPV